MATGDSAMDAVSMAIVLPWLEGVEAIWLRTTVIGADADSKDIVCV